MKSDKAKDRRQAKRQAATARQYAAAHLRELHAHRRRTSYLEREETVRAAIARKAASVSAVLAAWKKRRGLG